MGILQRVISRLKNEPSETRMRGDPIYAPIATMAGSGGLITPRLAENLSTVLACVSAISTSIASLPTLLYRVVDGNRIEARDQPLSRLIRGGPNEWQTWPDFVEWILASTLLRGNGLAEMVTDGRGAVAELRPIPWDWVSVLYLPSGRLGYDVADMSSIYGHNGIRRRLLASEVLHIRDRTDEGLIGRSRLQRAASVISTAVSVNEFSASMWNNQATPSGLLETVGKLSKEARSELKDSITQAMTGPGNARKVLVLDNGLTWKSISVSPEDAELLASRKFTVEELARLYGVPPPIVGHLQDSTFTNSETVGRWFASQTLRSWITKLEAEFTRSVFSDAARSQYELTWDLSALLRGDPELRWKSNQIAIDSGILTPNEVRGQEGWNAIAGGDVLRPRSAPAASAA